MYDERKIDDLISARRYRRSLFLVLSVVCKKLIVRPDYENIYNVCTFTAAEVKNCVRKPGVAEEFLERYTIEKLKFLVLNLREKYAGVVKNKVFKWRKWMDDANKLMGNKRKE